MQKRHLAAQLLSRKGADRESILAQLESYPDELTIMSISKMAQALEKSSGAICSRIKKLHKHNIRVGIKNGRYHVYTKEDFQKVKESYEKDYVYPSITETGWPVVPGSSQ